MEPMRREDLIENVEYGRMTPDEAEAEAARLGLAPLVTAPDPNAFDPMSRTWWTLVMAIAWISWRSPDKVREFWDDYRRECWDWHFRELRDGERRYFLKQREPATLSRLVFEADYDKVLQGLVPAEWISVEEAKASLWNART
jgi:hypothetical protein